MRNLISAILNKPLWVILASLLIALGIGYFSVSRSGESVQPTFVTAKSGSISLTGSSVPDGGVANLTLAFSVGGQIKSVNVKTGEDVKKGDILASLDPLTTAGSLTQARAAYAAAQAGYQKVINGASGPAIEVARAALKSAQVARDQAAHQQDVLVDNAYSALLNATPQAYPESANDNDQAAPVISGSYLLGKEGDIVIEMYSSGAPSGHSFQLSGLVSGFGTVSTVTPQPLGNSGLYVQFPTNFQGNTTWIVSIPNSKAPDYVAKSNAYQTAKQNKIQAVALADAAVNQAEANLSSVVAAARPEDVASAAAQVESARGAMQIAQAAYDQRRIIAPGDGTVTAVRISAGQVATANAPAIELAGDAFVKEVPVLVPKSAVFERDGKSYVRLKANGSVTEHEVVIGISDDQSVEIVSGLSSGEEVTLN